MKNLLKFSLLMSVFMIYPAVSKDLDRADIIGKVGDVTIAYKNNGANDVVRIYFTSTEKDRWGCIASTGYIEVSDESAYVTKERLQMIYTLALTAQTTGKSFGSGGPDDCKSQNFGILFQD